MPVDGHHRLTSGILDLVDEFRPTVSRGRTIAFSRTLTTLVWRPAVAGRWPLVVFAHGYGIGPAPYEPMLEAWASAGYVVAAPEFPLSDPAVAGSNLDENDLQNQPDDVRYVVDALVAPGAPLSGVIDAGRVVLAGHSDGAETVLVASLAPPPVGEPAIRAVVCLSVAPVPGQSATANPPILISQGDSDTVNPAARSMRAFAVAARPRYYLDLLGGGHLLPLLASSPWFTTIVATTLVFFHLFVDGGDPGALRRAGDRPPLSTLRSG